MININKYVKDLLSLAILLPVFHMEYFGSLEDPKVTNMGWDLGDKTIDLLQNEEAWCSEEPGDSEESWYSSIMTALNTTIESPVTNLESPMLNSPVYFTPGQRTPNNQSICTCNSSDQGIFTESQSIDDDSYFTPVRKRGSNAFSTPEQNTTNNKRYKVNQSPNSFDQENGDSLLFTPLPTYF